MHSIKVLVTENLVHEVDAALQADPDAKIATLSAEELLSVFGAGPPGTEPRVN